jgi:hypothetical protein
MPASARITTWKIREIDMDVVNILFESIFNVPLWNLTYISSVERKSRKL